MPRQGTRQRSSSHREHKEQQVNRRPPRQSFSCNHGHMMRKAMARYGLQRVSRPRPCHKSRCCSGPGHLRTSSLLTHARSSPPPHASPPPPSSTRPQHQTHTHVGQVSGEHRLGRGGDPSAEESRKEVLADAPRANAGAERGAQAGHVGHARQQQGAGEERRRRRGGGGLPPAVRSDATSRDHQRERGVRSCQPRWQPGAHDAIDLAAAGGWMHRQLHGLSTCWPVIPTKFAFHRRFNSLSQKRKRGRVSWRGRLTLPCPLHAKDQTAATRCNRGAPPIHRYKH